MSDTTNENDPFLTEAYDELDTWEQQQGEDFAEVQKILTGAAGRTKTTTIRFGNKRVDFEHVAAFTLEIRGEMTEAGLASADLSLSLVERNRPLYNVLAKICTKAPWNDWHAWMRVDVDTGETQTTYRKIVETVVGSEEGIARFRAGR
jgi:hypothetical protein